MFFAISGVIANVVNMLCVLEHLHSVTDSGLRSASSLILI